MSYVSCLDCCHFMYRLTPGFSGDMEHIDHSTGGVAQLINPTEGFSVLPQNHSIHTVKTGVSK